jgi:hypothetical protein
MVWSEQVLHGVMQYWQVSEFVVHCGRAAIEANCASICRELIYEVA